LSVSFAPDGKRLLSAGAHDGTLRLWDVETGKELKRIDGANAYWATLSPDGKRIVSAGYTDGIVRLWDAESGKELRQYEGHTGQVVGVTFFPDGSLRR
jgi:WD40 repeat protein